MDLSWLTAIEFSHALHICKGNKITVLKIMTSFKNRDGAFLVLQMIEKGRAYVHDVAHDHGFGILAVLVLNNKIISKIAEDFSANTGGVGTNEANVVGVADGIQANLLCCIQKGINNNLTVGEMRRRILWNPGWTLPLALRSRHWRERTCSAQTSFASSTKHEMGEGTKYGSSRFTNVALFQIKVCAQILDFNWLRIVQGNRLDTSKNDIFCYRRKEWEERTEIDLNYGNEWEASNTDLNTKAL